MFRIPPRAVFANRSPFSRGLPLKTLESRDFPPSMASLLVSVASSESKDSQRIGRQFVSLLGPGLCLNHFQRVTRYLCYQLKDPGILRQCLVFFRTFEETEVNDWLLTFVGFVEARKRKLLEFSSDDARYFHQQTESHWMAIVGSSKNTALCLHVMAYLGIQDQPEIVELAHNLLTHFLRLIGNAIVPLRDVANMLNSAWEIGVPTNELLAYLEVSQHWMDYTDVNGKDLAGVTRALARAQVHSKPICAGLFYLLKVQVKEFTYVDLAIFLSSVGKLEVPKNSVWDYFLKMFIKNPDLGFSPCFVHLSTYNWLRNLYHFPKFARVLHSFLRENLHCMSPEALRDTLILQGRIGLSPLLFEGLGVLEGYQPFSDNCNWLFLLKTLFNLGIERDSLMERIGEAQSDKLACLGYRLLMGNSGVLPDIRQLLESGKGRLTGGAHLEMVLMFASLYDHDPSVYLYFLRKTKVSKGSLIHLVFLQGLLPPSTNLNHLIYENSEAIQEVKPYQTHESNPKPSTDCQHVHRTLRTLIDRSSLVFRPYLVGPQLLSCDFLLNKDYKLPSV